MKASNVGTLSQDLFIKNDIYFTSFGNENINVHWYKILNVKGKKITLIELDSIIIEDKFTQPNEKIEIGTPFVALSHNLVITINEDEKIYASTKWDRITKIRKEY